MEYGFDVFVGATLLYFAYRGWRAGFVKAVLSVVVLVVAFWAMGAYGPSAEARLTFIADPRWRLLAAYVVIFVVILLAGGVVARLLRQLLNFAFLGWLDKLAGFVFGALKGAAIWIVVFGVLLKIFPNAPFLRESSFYPLMTQIMDYVKPWLHDNFVH